MGVKPHIGSGLQALKDTAENLALGLKAFSEGQALSFSKIIVSDNKPLILDASTFYKLDYGVQNTVWSDLDGVEVVKSNGNKSDIQVTGTLSDFQAANLITTNGTFATKLTDKTNLVEQITSYTINASVKTDAEITAIKISSLINLQVKLFH